MVEGFINNHESVVNMWSLPDIDRGILVVMSFYIKSQLTVYPLGIDCCQNSTIPFVKKRQYGFINIIVNQDNPFLCPLHKVAYEHISIEYLSVEQDALFGRQRRAEKEIHLTRQFLYLAVMLGKPMINTALHIKQTLIDTVTT